MDFLYQKEKQYTLRITLVFRKCFVGKNHWWNFKQSTPFWIQLEKKFMLSFSILICTSYCAWRIFFFYITRLYTLYIFFYIKQSVACVITKKILFRLMFFVFFFLTSFLFFNQYFIRWIKFSYTTLIYSILFYSARSAYTT